MSIDKSKLQLWKDKGLTLTDRLSAPRAVSRPDIDTSVLDRKIERGDISQELRLKYYPSIEIPFSDMYAGSYSGSLDELEDKLFSMGFRNNPTAYVEITDEFGPDDGSYARQVITEDQEFPYLGLSRPFGLVTWWNRVKEQVHIAVFIDDSKDLIHISAHFEASAWLQPARHLTVSTPSSRIGVREFRQSWFDEFDEELDKPLNL